MLSYGRTPTRHILVDGGRKATYAALAPRLKEIAGRGERLELLVVSHIDNDHIEGILALARDPAPPIEIAEVWFNAAGSAMPIETYGFAEAKALSSLIETLGWPLNTTFAGKPVVVDQGISTVKLAGDMTLRLLSPTTAALQKLDRHRDAWERKKRDKTAAAAAANVETYGRLVQHGRPDVEALISATEIEDTEPANGSSIAFIAEWNGRRVLLAADAHPSTLTSGLRGLAAAGSRYPIDLIKVSHHGAARNTSQEFVEATTCRSILISTDGSHHGHPDPQSIARFLAFAPAGKKTIYLNYSSINGSIWNDTELFKEFDYALRLPEAQSVGVIDIDIDAAVRVTRGNQTFASKLRLATARKLKNCCKRARRVCKRPNSL